MILANNQLFNKKVIAVLIVILLSILLPLVASAAEECGTFDLFCHLRNFGSWLISWVAVAVQFLFGTILFLAGLLFDLAVKYSVVDFRSLVDNLKVVDIGWALLRDLANILFIFILLYVAIGIILQLNLAGGGAKKIIVKVIIVALLINFSAFAARLVIDASNVLAYQFYQAMSPQQGSKSLSAVIVGGTGLQRFFDQPTFETIEKARQTIASAGIIGIITRTFLNIILILVTAFVLFTAALLFTVRTIVLTMLIVLSPLAFIAFVFPGMSDHGRRWWNTLLKEALFAPLSLFFIFIVYSIITKGALRIEPGDPQASQGFIPTLYNFSIIIGLMLGGLIVAKKLGAAGASGAMKLAGLATAGGGALALRQTVGRTGQRLLESQAVKNMTAKGGLIGLAGRGLERGARAAAGASFDIRGTRIGKAVGLPKVMGKPGGKGGFAAGESKYVERQKQRAGWLAEETPEETPKDVRDEERARQEVAMAEEAVGAHQQAIEKKKAELADAEKAGLVGPAAEARRQELQREIQRMEDEKMRALQAKVEEAKRKAAEARAVTEAAKAAPQKRAGQYAEKLGKSRRRKKKKAADAIRAHLKKSPEERAREEARREIEELKRKEAERAEKEAGTEEPKEKGG